MVFSLSRDAKVDVHHLLINEICHPAGAPVIMSPPHYLDSDTSLSAAFDGVSPDLEKHITYLHIEPTTGQSLLYSSQIASYERLLLASMKSCSL